MKRISKRQILAMHRALAEETGSSYGVRDEGLLDSALAQPFQTFGGKELYPSVEEKAARLAFGIAKNHPLADGNKRLAAHAALVFLAVNGIWLRYTQQELSALFFGVADGTVSAEELSCWVGAHIKDWCAIERKFDEFGLVYAKHCTFEHWYDKDGNVIRHRDKNGERWHDYDERGNMVHSIYHLQHEGDSEVWREYDAAGNEIHRKDDRGYERWYEYDMDGKVVHYKDSNGLKGRYDKEKNKLYFKFGDNEEWREYDAGGNEVLCFAKKIKFGETNT